MKYIAKILTCLFLTMAALIANASSYRGAGSGEYFVGANFQYLFLKPRLEYQDFFRKNQPGVDLYVGYRMNNMLGFEFGYGWSTRVSKEVSYTAGQQVLNNNLTLDNLTDVTGKLRYRNTHLDVNGYYPLGSRIDGILSLGVGFLRPHPSITLSNPAANLNNEVANIATKTTATMRVGVGLEGLLNDYWGLRSMIRYENTSRMSVRNAGVGGNKILKDGFSVGLGFYRYLD
jgi:opacity protein-like surface antigen